MSPHHSPRDLEAHETKTSNQVVVLTLPSLEDEPLESFSHRVATTWKLGQKGTENGVLLLRRPARAKVRIEVGYGLEGTLTDLRSAHIIRQEIVPRFRSGDLPGGIAAGVAGDSRIPLKAPTRLKRCCLGMAVPARSRPRLSM